MTHPMDDSFHPQPKVEGSQCEHTQESGVDGLSFIIEHRFNVHYDDDKHSYVRPIPKEELGVCEWSSMGGEMMKLQLSEVESPPYKNVKVWSTMALTKPESHSVAAVAQDNNFPPHAVFEEGCEEEAVNTSPGTTTTGAGEVELESHIMDTGKNPVKLKNPPLVWKRVRNGSAPRRRAERNTWKVCILMALVFFPACGGAQQPGNQKLKCYACKDEDKCPKLMNIYDRHNDKVPLYSKDKDAFPECSANCTPVSAPLPKNCAVCHVQDQIYIVCTEDVGEIDVEAGDGSAIGNISAVDEWQQPYSCADTGLSPSMIWTVLAVAAGFVIHSTYW